MNSLFTEKSGMITNSILSAKHVKALKDYYRDSNKQSFAWASRRYRHPPPESLPYPEICRGIKYEAKTRSGHPCKNDGTSWANGRCKYHGGASTGPVTLEGKLAVSKNARKQTPCEVNKS